MFVQYGRCSYLSYQLAVEGLANLVSEENFGTLSEKINTAFFGGEPFAPKSFSHLTTLSTPARTPFLFTNLRGEFIYIRPIFSWSAFLGYLESIPLIGTALAIINTLGHFILGVKAYYDLKGVVDEFKALPQDERATQAPSYSEALNQVFATAVTYTVHRNHLLGSLLAIIPLAKPLTRLSQGILHHHPDFVARANPIK